MALEQTEAKTGSSLYLEILTSGVCIENGPGLGMNSSDSDSDFPSRDVRLRVDGSRTESSYSSDELNGGIQPYRFEPETSDSDSHSDGEAEQHDAVAVAYDI